MADLQVVNLVFCLVGPEYTPDLRLWLRLKVMVIVGDSVVFLHMIVPLEPLYRKEA